MIHGNEEMLPRVESVIPSSDFTLIITFRNGERKIFDAKPLLNVPMYRNLAKVFQSARADYGTVIFSGDLDISPDTLYLNSKEFHG